MRTKESPDDPRARLQDLAARGRVSLASLSAMIGRNSSYLQQYITRGSPRKLEEQDRRKLAEFFGVGESELGGPEENSLARAVRGDWVEVPRLSLDASAGPGALSFEEVAFDTFHFSPRWMQEHGLASSQLSAITVAGDSMFPLLRDGDEILVDRSQRSLREGIYVVRIGDALHVKRLQAAGPGRISLLSENEAYPAVDLMLDDVDVVGRVVWKGGRI